MISSCFLSTEENSLVSTGGPSSYGLNSEVPTHPFSSIYQHFSKVRLLCCVCLPLHLYHISKFTEVRLFRSEFDRFGTRLNPRMYCSPGDVTPESVSGVPTRGDETQQDREGRRDTRRGRSRILLYNRKGVLGNPYYYYFFREN